MRTGIGVLTIVYGGVLCLFWAVVLLRYGDSQDSWAAVPVALAFAAVAALLVVTGLALYQGRPSARRLAFVSAGLLGLKALVVGGLAALLLNDSGNWQELSHAIGWTFLAVVVGPSAAWALLLVRAATARPPAEAADYDDARLGQ
jgi:hypothetical protein